VCCVSSVVCVFVLSRHKTEKQKTHPNYYKKNKIDPQGAVSSGSGDPWGPKVVPEAPQNPSKTQIALTSPHKVCNLFCVWSVCFVSSVVFVFVLSRHGTKDASWNQFIWKVRPRPRGFSHKRRSIPKLFNKIVHHFQHEAVRSEGAQWFWNSVRFTRDLLRGYFRGDLFPRASGPQAKFVSSRNT
jgi:hypothetical protein